MHQTRLTPGFRALGQFVKRAFDFVAAFAAVLLLAPLLVVISVAIRRDSKGPILFRQLREGYRRSLFTILKFRTMVDKTKDLTEFQQARKVDPRVTRVGAYLRRSSFDELPQLLNVLAGHMSLVGPRPHVPALSARYAGLVEGYYDRLNALPGITGLAQISGYRGETDTPKKMAGRIRWDLEYIARWSFMGDLRICFRTLAHWVRTALTRALSACRRGNSRGSARSFRLCPGPPRAQRRRPLPLRSGTAFERVACSAFRAG